VAGTHAYVAKGWGDAGIDGAGLAVIDVSDPAHPVCVGRHDTSGYFAGGVAVAGDYACVTVDGNLLVIDVGDPANPVSVGGYATSGHANDVAMAGNYAYVADCLRLQVIDVSDPANPVRVGGYGISGCAYDVAVEGNHAYVADGEAGLHVIDVSNPANPVRVGGHDTSGLAVGVAKAGQRICVADWDSGLVVLAWLPNVQCTVRVEGAATGTPCVLAASPVVGPAAAWTPLFTNLSPGGPFDFVDPDGNVTEHPQKFYRAYQP
jgi:hypothetical protein